MRRLVRDQRVAIASGSGLCAITKGGGGMPDSRHAGSPSGPFQGHPPTGFIDRLRGRLTVLRAATAAAVILALAGTAPSGPAAPSASPGARPAQARLAATVATLLGNASRQRA